MPWQECDTSGPTEYLLKSTHAVTDSLNFIFLEMPRNENINKFAINIRVSI